MNAQDVNDIFYSVILVEKTGADFYRKLAGETRNPAAKEMFLGLVKDEVQHQKDFQDMAQAMQQKGWSVYSATNLAEVMRAVADKLQRILQGAEPVDMDEVGLKQALDIGIHNEKESIRVYTELQEIKHPDLARLLERVIEEEKKHLSVLEELKTERLG